MRVSVRGAFVAVLLILLASGDAFARGGRAGGGRPSGGRATPGGFQRSGPAGRPNINRSNATRPLPNPNASRNTHGPNGPRPVPPAVGNRVPGAAGVNAHAQLHPGQSHLQTQAARVRHAAGASYANLFTPQWYRNHPAAWHARHPHADLWAAASWAALAGWVGVNHQPVVYGGTDSAVYLDGEEAEEYVSKQEPSAETAEAGEWLPLGVFALVPDGGGADTYFILQLAIDRQGAIGGSYHDIVADSTLPIHGSIDKKTQQAVWTIGPNKTTVMQTDLKNITESQSPVRMSFGKDRKQDWLLVRLQNTK